MRTSPIQFDHLAEKSEKGSVSNLSTKVRALPSPNDMAAGLPGAAAVEDLVRFRELPVARSALRNLQHRKQVYGSLRKCFRDGAEPTFELFAHVQNLVDTRYYNSKCVRPTWLGKTTEWCGMMVPLSDMANYSVFSNCFVF